MRLQTDRNLLMLLRVRRRSYPFMKTTCLFIISDNRYTTINTKYRKVNKNSKMLLSAIILLYIGTAAGQTSGPSLPVIVPPPPNPLPADAFTRKLWQTCTSDYSCAVQFSTCTGGHCHCRPGYTRKGATCDPIAHFCPFGNPL